MKHERFSIRPLYLQVRDALVQRIVEGVWPSGSAIPNETHLAQEFGISVGTIRKALEAMEHEKIVARRQGRGTFVTDQSTGEMAIRFSSIKNGQGLKIEGTLISLSVEAGEATPEEIEKMRLGSEKAVVRVHRVHRYKDHAFMIEMSVLPKYRFPVLPDNVGGYRIYAIAQVNKIYLGYAEEMVSARLANQSEAKHLEIAVGDPLLSLDRVISCIDNTPVEWRRAACYLREKHYSSMIM